MNDSNFTPLLKQERMRMTKFSWVLLATTFVGSVIGGMLGERLFDRGIVRAEKANSVNAEEFLLVDSNGKARAGLGLDANGEVGLILTSRDGNRKLTLTPDGPIAVKLTNGVNAEEFSLMDQDGKARAGLGLNPNGEVGLILTSRDGNRKLTLSPDGQLAVKLTTGSGRIVWSAP
jgi:hypothetical protein